MTITRLRYVKSKDADKIVEFVNRLLHHKIEIKGNPVLNGKTWFLWFNLPDDLIKESLIHKVTNLDEL